MTPVDFPALLIPPVLLRLEVTLRLYGALSTTWRRRLGWIENPAVHEPPPAAIPATAPGLAHREDSSSIRDRKRSWARLIKKVYFEDPQFCNSCRQPMKIIAAIAPEEVNVIERILRSLKLWDPRRMRPRKARGPPPTARADSSAWTPAPTEEIDPIIEDDLYAIDPVPPDGDDHHEGDPWL